MKSLGTARLDLYYQLRQSLLTHKAEYGTITPMLLARSRHASVWPLERHARPGPEAVAHADPAARRRHPGGARHSATCPPEGHIGRRDRV